MTVERITTIPTPPYRASEGHKGTFGRVLVIGGSVGMSGAPALAGRTALRSGAGLVTIAVPAPIQTIVAAIDPSYTTQHLAADEEGRIRGPALAVLLDNWKDYTAIALGPGLGRSDELEHEVRRAYVECPVPMVVDADALNLLAREPVEEWQRSGAPRVLTPHPGEFARLMRIETSEIAENRESLAVQLARQTGAVIVLKGAGTVVTDGARLSINPTGNDGLATGGAGDVLTGLTAGLLAQRMPAFEAARLAVYVHGLAADLAAETLSRPGLIASDLPEWVARAWRFWGE